MIPYITVALAALATLLTPLVSSAADYPTKPITVVVGYPAGGATDIAARLVADQLKTKLGQSVIIENRPGAGGEISVTHVANSAPDGYTLLFAASAMAINRALKGGQDDASLKALRPLSLVGRLGYVVVVNSKSPINSFQGLIEAAKKEPGKISFASFGAGTSNHLIGELIKAKTGIDILHVPFTGSAPAVANVLGGHVTIGIETVGVVQDLIKSGQLKALAVTGSERSPLLPDVPTMAEATAIPELAGTTWYGFLAPAGISDQIAQTLTDNIAKIVKSDRVSATMKSRGVTPVGSNGAEFGELIQREIKLWSNVAKLAGIAAN